MNRSKRFSVGQVVINRVRFESRESGVAEPGTRFRIVHITPKVRRTSRYLIDQQPDRYDGSEFFLNLDTIETPPRRFRECFVTIQRESKGCKLSN